MRATNDSAVLRFPPRCWEWSPWQRQVWRETAGLSVPDTIVLVAGRGAGKDIVATRCIARDMFKWFSMQAQRKALGKLRVKLNPLVKVWVAAPQDNNLKQAWEDWNGELGELADEWGEAAGQEVGRHEWLFREVVRENKLLVMGRRQLEIEKRITSTKDALRGPGVDLVHWTEAAVETVDGEFEQKFTGELPGTIVRSGRLGRVYLTTTPKGPMGGFWDMLCERFGEREVMDTSHKLMEKDGSWASCWSKDRSSYLMMADSYANEFLTPEQVAKFKREEVNGWFYLQERKAQFVVGDVGGEKAYERELVESIIGSASKGAAKGYRQYRIGIDVARMGDDLTWYLVLDEESGEVLWLEQHKKMLGNEIVDDMKRLALQWPGATFAVDGTGDRGGVKDHVPSTMQVDEVNFRHVKESMVGGLRMLMQMKRVHIPNPDTATGMAPDQRKLVRELIRQLVSFQRRIKQTGVIEFAAPKGDHDDAVAALLLASRRLATKVQDEVATRRTGDVVRKLGL